MDKKKENKLVLILIMCLIFIDQLIKIIIKIKGISIEKNIDSEENIKYIFISIVAIIVLIRYIKSNNTYIKLKNKIILGFAISGVTSNIIDRIIFGHVINYINIPKFFAINLSYIYFIVTWIGIAVILTIHTHNVIKEKKGRKINEKKDNSKKL